MDPVNKKELKGKFKDRTDKDIDNDGDVDSSDKYLHRRRKAISKSKGETATMNPKLDSGKSKGSEMEQKESVDYHSHMANAHYQHSTAHESEVTNGGHDDHDYASNAHYDAHKAHKAAADAHKKHGGDSPQYKSAAKKAKSATADAKEQSSSAGSFKKVAKPKISLGGSSSKKPPLGSPASRGIKAPGYTKMKMTSKGLQKESTIREKLIAVLEGDRAKHYKGAAEAEPMDNNLKGAGAKKMKADYAGYAADPDLEKKSHDDAAKAGRVTGNAKKRPNDNPKGDTKIINPPEDVTKKGQGSAEVKESRDKLAGIKAAYASMYESEIEEGIIGDMLAKRKEHKAMASKIKAQHDNHDRVMKLNHSIADEADAKGNEDEGAHHHGIAHKHSVAKDYMADALAAHNKKDYKARDKHIAAWKKHKAASTAQKDAFN